MTSNIWTLIYRCQWQLLQKGMSSTALHRMLQEVAALVEQEEFRSKSGSFGQQRRSPQASPPPPHEPSNDGLFLFATLSLDTVNCSYTGLVGTKILSPVYLNNRTEQNVL